MRTCAFCGCDPYHYVNNGLGMEAVAVTCCDLGIAVYGKSDPDSEITITAGELKEIATKVSSMRSKLSVYAEKEIEMEDEREQPIKAIYGHEPMRQGEYADGYTVGHNSVAQIVKREDYYGDHSVCWYDALREDGSKIGSMNARAVALIIWKEGEPQ